MVKTGVKRLLIVLVMYALVAGCSITKKQNQGYVLPNQFHYKSQYSTIKSLIAIPVEINGTSKNFLFDTGADFTFIQRDTSIGKLSKIGGASNRNMQAGNEIVKSFKIGDIDFKDTYAINGDLAGLKEQVPNFGGLIGQSIISKACWLIDYPHQTIELSNKGVMDSTFSILKIHREHGAPYIYLTIDGIQCKALIDLGSSSAITIPENSELAQRVQKSYEFRVKERDVFSIGGLQKTTEKVGYIPSILTNSMELKNIAASIRHTSQLRIGNDFFKGYILYIDNSSSSYRIKRAD